MLVTIRFELPDEREYTRHWYHVPRVGDQILAALLDTDTDPPTQHIHDWTVLAVTWVDEEAGREPTAVVTLGTPFP